MSPQRARSQNKAQSKKFERSLKKIQDTILFANLPTALDEAGEAAADYAKATHTYGNITGDLERSTTHALVAPRSDGEFVFDSSSGKESFPVSNPKNEWLLVLGAGKHYAVFVELTHGYDVVLHAFVKLRNELGKVLAAKLRHFRIK